MVSRTTFYIFLFTVCLELMGAEWSYEGKTGPEYWSTKFPECGNRRQSPINIVSRKAEPRYMAGFEFYGYNDTQEFTNISVWNDKYTVSVQLEGDLQISRGGLRGRYSLAQMHLHWGSANIQGSEHAIDGKTYPLEIHFVHKTNRIASIVDALNDVHGLAVLGILVKIGRYNPYFERIVSDLPEMDIGEAVKIEPFPLGRLLPNDTENFYRYEGSLTTPPCSQSVIWTVFRQHIEVSQEQVNKLRMVSEKSKVKDNYRPIQSLSGRPVYVRKKPPMFPNSVARAAVFNPLVFILFCAIPSIIYRLSS